MVYVFLANGFEEVEAITPIDYLKRAEIPVEIVSVEQENIVVGAHNINIIADCNIKDIDIDKADMIVLPGGMPGTLNLKKNSLLNQYIDYCYSREVFIGAICAAPMILGEKQMLKGKKATCYPSFEKYLLGCNYNNENLCVDKNIITCKSAGYAQDFAFALIEALKGKELTKSIRSSVIC